MGLTIENKYNAIDVTYVGFMRIQKRIAKLIADDFFKYYDSFCDLSYEETQEDNKKVSAFMKKYNIPVEILDFLFKDNEKLSRNGVKKLYQIIKDDKEDFCIGYLGRNDCATYQKFVKIVKESYSKRMCIIWS